MTNPPPAWANVHIGLGSTNSNASDNSHTAAEFLAQIANGTYELEIDCIRDALMNEDTDEAQRQKIQLPAVTWSGSFSQRRADALLAHTGILCVDIDHIDSFDDTSKLQQRIGADPHTAAVFRSPSGCGLKVLVLASPAPTNDSEHKKLFSLVERHFLDTYSLPIDPACKDVSRLCFLSCDPQMIVNDAPVPFAWQAFEATSTWEPKQAPQRPVVPAGVALKPGEDYDARGDFFALLKAHGWKPLQGGKYWTRPGKNAGISASWGHHPGMFWVFSSSTELEQGRSYTPWQVYAMLEHGGDFRAAARQLAAEGYGEKREKSEKPVAPDEEESGVLGTQVVPEEELPDRAPFPADLFAPAARAMIDEIERIHGVDADIPAACILSAVSAVLGRGLQVECRGRRTMANVFTIIGAKSGIGKSVTSQPIFEPVALIDNEETEESNPLATMREARKRAADAMIKALERPVKDEGPADRHHRENLIREELERKKTIEDAMVPPRILAENVTTEKLAHLLWKNREQICVFSADCGDVVANLLGRYSEGTEDESLLLKAFSGDPIRVDRMGRESIALKSPCLALCLIGTQPVMRKLWANDQFRTGGLLPRLLPVFSESLPVEDDGSTRAIDPQAKADWEHLVRELHSAYHESEEIQLIEVTPEAGEVFRNARNEFVRLCRTGGMPDLFASFQARESEQAIRIAAILHAIEHGAQAHTYQMTEATALAGVEMARWFIEQHRDALHDALRADDAEAAAKLTAKLKARGGSATMRDLKRLHMNEGEVLRMVERYPAKFELVEDDKTGAGRKTARVNLK
jgi:hypothetical protein